MKNSHIEWTDHTFNPVIGCTKDTRMGRVKWGKGQRRSRTSADYWREPVKWNREADVNALCAKHILAEGDASAERIAKAQRRPRVFCASLADWLDYEWKTEWRVDLLNLIDATPNLDWQLLTKRPESWSARLHEAAYGSPLALRWLNGEAPANVWVGTSVEDQPRADERIPELLSIPARVRFLSMEPLLGAVRLGGALYSDYDKAALQDQLLVPADGFTNAKVNWVIVGGESGSGARPMHPDWARDIRDECEEAGTHFFFKQWGEWLPACQLEFEKAAVRKAVGQHVIMDGTHIFRVGKKAAGRLLDGREWSECPAP